MKKTLDKLDIAVQQKEQKEDRYLQADIAALKAVYYYNTGNTDLTLSYLKDCLDIVKSNADFSYRIDDLYNTQGFCHIINGDLNSANSSISKCLSYSENENDLSQVIWYSALGQIQSKLGNKGKANKHFQKAFFILSKHQDSDSRHKYLYNDLIPHYLKYNQLDSAKIYLDKLKLLSPENHELVNYYKSLSLYYYKSGDFENNYKYLLKGKELIQSNLNLNKFKKAQNLHLISKSLREQKLYAECIKSADEGLDILRNNARSNESQSINSFVALDLLYEKSVSYLEQADENNFKNSLNQYTQTLNNIISIKIINESTSYQFNHKIYSDIITLIESLLEKDKKDLAYNLLQFQKGYLLKVKLNYDLQDKLNFSNDLINREQELKIKISELEIEQSLQNDVISDSLHTLMYDLQSELSSIKTNKLNTSPGFRAMTQNLNIEFDTKYHETLSREECIIEYLLKDDELFTFVTQKSGLQVYKQKMTEELRDNITLFNSYLQDLESEIPYARFTESGYTLYSLLLKPILQDLDSDIVNMHIIPDDILFYIPFEALLTDKTDTDPGRFDLLPYVVKDYQISYHYSSALLRDSESTLSTYTVGFAPSFDRDTIHSDNLGTLFHNQTEVENIQSVTQAEIFLDTSATLKRFNTTLANTKILHLATHAVCNDSIPLESKIFFHDHPIHAYEIYNMSNDIDLAVLSACQTGDGAMIKGEGPMSLARAFISNGCKSVVNSLWNVDDKNSVELMNSFYEHLFDQKTVGESLTHSKRDYLNSVSSSLQAHPYHWATFINIGNSELRIKKFAFLPLLLIALICIALVILSYILHNRRL